MGADQHLAHFVKEFLQEAKEIIDSVTSDILQLESDPENPELINSVFRGVHTIKGCAGTFELDTLSEFTHHLEGLLNLLRDGKIELNPEMVDAILSGLDHISVMVNAVGNGEVPAGDPELEQRFKSFCKVAHPDSLQTACCDNQRERPIAGPGLSGTSLEAPAAGAFALDVSGTDLPAAVADALKNAASDNLNVFAITLNYTSELLENGYDPIVLLQNIKRNSRFYYARSPREPVPPIDRYEPLTLYLNPVVYVGTDMSEDQVVELCMDPSLIAVRDLKAANLNAEVLSPEFAEVVDSAEAMKEFVEGAAEMLDSAEKAVIEYEQNGNSSALNEIFRVAHNIKGDAAFMGFKDLSAFCHTFESLLDRLRAGTVAKTSDIVDAVLQALDYLRGAITNLAEQKTLPELPPIYETLKQYERVNRFSAPGDTTAELLPKAPDELRKVYEDQLRQYQMILRIHAAADPFDEGVRSAARRTLGDLMRASRVAGQRSLSLLAEKTLSSIAHPGSTETGKPPGGALQALIEAISDLSGEPKRLGEILVEEGKLSPQDLEAILKKQRPIGEMLIEAGKVTRDDVEIALKKQKQWEATPAEKPEDAGDKAIIRTMRVDEIKVEQITNIIGEILVARNTYEYLLNQLGKTEGDGKNVVKALGDNLHLFSRLTNDIHHGVMALRMIPIRGIFQKFTRVVRDISRKQKKAIDLMTDGEDIEIDKKVSDVLSDPMVHLIRNSCDHGIETALERKRIGKPERGTLILKATRAGSSINIHVVDDGRGINRRRLFEKAVEKGIPVSSVNDPALLELIFKPGLSTSEKVTDISGRGVGMDVVKTTIQSLGGSVSVTSEEGHGTEIILSIPMTLGIETVLLIESGDNSYGIPIDAVVETIRVSADKFIKNRNRRMFQYRGEVLMVNHLKNYIESDGNGNRLSDAVDGQEEAVVIIKAGHGKFGVVVDRFNKNMEIAVKPVPDALSGLDILSGVSIMGDGKVLLVLNPDRLVN